MRLIRTINNSFVPAFANNKDAIRDKMYVVFDYIEVFLTFLLGAALVTGLVIQSFKNLTYKSHGIVKHEVVKHKKVRKK